MKFLSIFDLRKNATADALNTLRNRKTRTGAFQTAAHVVCEGLVGQLQSKLKGFGLDTRSVVFISILRSGIVFIRPAVEAFPGSRIGFFGLKRDEQTFEPHLYYENLPPLTAEDTVVILDPMLATGGTAEATASKLIGLGALPRHIFFLGIVAAPEGVERLGRLIPRENMILATVDQGLDDKKYIVPGLGDFGDRYFGYSDGPAK